MKTFIMLLHDAGFPDDISPEQIQAIIQRYVAWREKIQRNGRKVSGHKLTDGQGRVMRGAGGQTRITGRTDARVTGKRSALARSSPEQRWLTARFSLLV